MTPEPRRPIIDLTGYQAPTPRVFDPCAVCSSTEHILCDVFGGYLTIVDHTGTHTRRIPQER